MAEDKFNSNAKSPRFSTSKAIGFKGGQQPSFQQAAGINPVAPATSPKPAPTGATVNPAISQFEAPRVPQQPGLLRTVGTGVATSVAGQAIKQGAGAAGNAIGNAFNDYMTPKGYLPGGGYSSETMRQSFATPETANMSMDPSLIGERNAVMELGGRPPVPSFLNPDAAAYSETYDLADADMGAGFADGASSFAGDAATYGTDIGASFADTADLADADMGAGFASDAAGTAGSVMPYAGSIIRAAQGDYEGAAGSAIGAYIGSAILPGIGTAVGSWLGSLFCVAIEETYANVGSDPNGPEAQALRSFAGMRASDTQEGMQFAKQYAEVAPQLIAIISELPNAQEIWQQNYTQYVSQAALALQSGDEERAGQLVTEAMWFLISVAEESSGGQGITNELMALGSLADKAFIDGRSDGTPPEPGMQQGMMQGIQQGGGQPIDVGAEDPMRNDDDMMAGGGMMPTGAPMMPSQGMQMPQMAGPQQPPIAQTFARRY